MAAGYNDISYYIRETTSYLPSITVDCETDNGRYQFYALASILYTKYNLFKTHADNSRPINKVGISGRPRDYLFGSLDYHNGFTYKSYFVYYGTNGISENTADHWTSHGWTGGTYATFRQEIVNDIAKAILENSAAWGQDNYERNVVLDTIICDGTTYYVVFFYKGNDPSYTTKIINNELTGW